MIYRIVAGFMLMLGVLAFSILVEEPVVKSVLFVAFLLGFHIEGNTNRISKLEK